jgi:multicomponent K+:H+ antiporter subunit D
LLGALLTPGRVGPLAPPAWCLVGLLLLSGLAATVSLTRAGIRHFFAAGERLPPRLKGVEVAAVAGLVLACVLLTVYAEPVLRLTRATAAELHAPRAYIEAVSAMRPRPGPTRAAVGP